MSDKLLTPERLAEIEARHADAASTLLNISMWSPRFGVGAHFDRTDLLSHARAMQALLVERDARIERLTKALHQFGRHKEHCRTRYGWREGGSCDCDLNAVLSEARPERRDPQAPKDRREAVAQYFIKDRKPRTGKDRRKQEG